MATQRIFISYRRRDTGPVVDRIFDVLATVFGQENVFRDLQSIDAGVPFDEAVQRSISRCNVFLAIIGLSWLSEFEGAERRLDRPNDPVRLEIEAALRSRVTVIPVLVNGANMPHSNDLPDSIQHLSRINATVLAIEAFHNDMRRLCGSLHDYDPAAFAHKLRPAFRDDLVLPVECQDRLQFVLDDVRHRAKLRDKWGFERLEIRDAMIVLFCGPAGCGKTLAARVMAHQLELDLYQVNLEEARLRWNVGDRLPIDWLFRRAVASPVLLQLRDTAGALVATQNGTGDRGALAASLIRQLEDRSGFMIVSARSEPTKESVSWQFDHVVTFPFPDQSARTHIWRRTVPPELPCDADIDFSALAAHELSGDAIRRALKNAALFAARDGRAMCMNDCVEAIHLELGNRR